MNSVQIRFCLILDGGVPIKGFVSNVSNAHRAGYDEQRDSHFPRELCLPPPRSSWPFRCSDITADRLKESLDKSRIHRVPTDEFVRGFEPVDAPVFSGDEAVKAGRHVNRYTRISLCHLFLVLPK